MERSYRRRFLNYYISSPFAPFRPHILPFCICIYPRTWSSSPDAATARAKRLLRQARAAAGKPIGALLSVADFCHHTSLGEHQVTVVLNRWSSAANSDWYCTG